MERDIEMSKEVEVGGMRYLISHPNPEIAWEVGVELTKYIAEPMASMSLSGGNEEAAGQALPMAVRALLNKIDAKQSLELIKKILSWVEIQGPVDGPNKKQLITKEVFKIHFIGRSGDPLRLASEVVGFTHSDFFDAIADGVAGIMKKAGEKIPA